MQIQPLALPSFEIVRCSWTAILHFPKRLLLVIYICLAFVISNNSIFAQDNRFLQIDANAGYSIPVGSFSQQHMFAGKGAAYAGGFDYFLGKFGLGFHAGTFSNDSQQPFSDYIQHKYLERPNNPLSKEWKSVYGMFGPVYKHSFGNFEWDFFIRGGYSNITVPSLLFVKSFFDQTYDVYRFSGGNDEWQFAWSAGTRFTYKINHWLGLHLRADYFTTQYMSTVNYTQNYRNAEDLNVNGVIDDAEYFTSQRIETKSNTALSVMNLNLGLSFQLGKKGPVPSVTMIPPIIDLPIQDTTIQEIALLTPTFQDSILEQNEPVVSNDSPKADSKNIPIINEKEEPKVSEELEDIVTIESIAIPETHYDAPEAMYDEEAAEFLYKAGEAYFAANDFENAVPCFNKLKADPKYPRAKYMFALSLCSMGNCAEARKEYKDFAKTYKAEDARTLEIIFASHIERCRLSGPLLPVKAQTNSVQKSDNNPPKAGTSYKIQFIAMKKPNANFPKLDNIGDISTEFYPNKSVFRYTLGEYTDEESVAKDVYKVRKMGYRDAFVAVYENGVRVNTIYHAR